MKLSAKIFCVLIIAAIMISAASCSGEHNNKEDDKKLSAATVTPPLVALCSNIDYSDTFALRNDHVMRKTVARIARLLASTDSVNSRTALGIFFNGLRHDPQSLSLATGYADQYLNNLGSPLRDEEMYIRVLTALLSVDSLPDYERERATERLRIASLNRRGSIANNIHFEEPNGSRHTLHGIKSPLTLVAFYDPECSHCSKILAAIAADSTVNAAIRDGHLKVVAIYAEGKRDIWRGNVSEMPSNWTVGYDRSAILDNDLYDLPAMPTLYLLDAHKRVLLKDPDHRLLSTYLSSRATSALP